MINPLAVKIYLTRIHDDLGYETLLQGIIAVETHVTAFERKHSKAMRTIREAIDDIKSKFLNDESFLKLVATFQHRVNESIADISANRLVRLAMADVVPAKMEVQVTVYKRNPDVVAQTLVNAKGNYPRCNKPAPLKRNNQTPFLEVHHIIPLAEGGFDTVANARAICPNCHREAHYGAETVTFN